MRGNESRPVNILCTVTKSGIWEEKTKATKQAKAILNASGMFTINKENIATNIKVVITYHPFQAIFPHWPVGLHGA